MNTVGEHPLERPGHWIADEALSVAVGAMFTFGIFLALAHFEASGAVAAGPEIEEMKSVSIFTEPPPPKVEDQPKPPEVDVPLTGIEIARSDSPVAIAVVPPDLAKIVPSTEIPPRATIQLGQLFTDLRPRTQLLGGYDRIYQQAEVDQKAAPVYRAVAKVSRRVRDNADQLRVTLLFVVNADGTVSDMRVLNSSGNVEFDQLIAKCIQDEWVFSPALVKGKKVRVLVEQAYTYRWTADSPFTL